MLAALVGVAWFSLNVRVEGRTPYEHFRAAGGETAVMEGLSWVRSQLARGGHAVWAWTKSGVRSMAQWLTDSAGFGDAEESREARGPSSESIEASVANPPTMSAGPEAVPSALARARVERLRRAAPSDAAHVRTKLRTHVDPRLAPEHKRALEERMGPREGR